MLVAARGGAVLGPSPVSMRHAKNGCLDRRNAYRRKAGAFSGMPLERCLRDKSSPGVVVRGRGQLGKASRQSRAKKPGAQIASRYKRRHVTMKNGRAHAMLPG
jgi:hypothetical protein